MGVEALSTEALMADYHTSFVKCWDDKFKLVVLVPVANVRAVTWAASERALIWLKEPVPLGVNDSTAVLYLYYEPKTTVGLLVEPSP